MWQDGIDTIYKSYRVPKEIEEMWADEAVLEYLDDVINGKSSAIMHICEYALSIKKVTYITNLISIINQNYKKYSNHERFDIAKGVFLLIERISKSQQIEDNDRVIAEGASLAKSIFVALKGELKELDEERDSIDSFIKRIEAFIEIG